MNISSAIFKGCWVEERNMGDTDELLKVVKAQGYDASILTDAAQSEDTAGRYQAHRGRRQLRKLLEQAG